MYYFYILYSETLDKYYYGHSNNLDDRLRKHNANNKGWTGKAHDWTIVYHEIFETKGDAYSREIQIKKWKNRERIKSLIRGFDAGS